MKALTLHQPWATAVANFGKRVENRTWAPPPSLVGRRLAIHAGKTWDREGARLLAERFGFRWTKELEAAFPRGAVVAVATLVGTLPFPACGQRPEYSRLVAAERDSWWFTGPIGWVLADVVPIASVPSPGRQGLWTLSDEAERAVVEAERFGTMLEARAWGEPTQADLDFVKARDSLKAIVLRGCGGLR